MSYIIENEKLSRTSFLDLQIILKDLRKFTTSVYHKPSFSRVYGIRLSHIFEIPISNEKPSTSIEILSISDQKF